MMWLTDPTAGTQSARNHTLFLPASLRVNGMRVHSLVVPPVSLISIHTARAHAIIGPSAIRANVHSVRIHGAGSRTLPPLIITEMLETVFYLILQLLLLVYSHI